MRIVSNQIISDNLLKKYSYEGRRGKMPFNKFEKVIDLIVKSTTLAFNNHNARRKKFKAVSEEEVEDYFRVTFIKCAKQRDNQSINLQSFAC